MMDAVYTFPLSVCTDAGLIAAGGGISVPSWSAPVDR
jgi:hypothetical protein